MGRIERINEVVKNHDPKLFCSRMGGKLCVMRESWKWEPYEVDGDVYYFVRPNHFFILALTHDWKFNSQEADWGLLPLAQRLRDIDVWNRDMVSEIEEKYDREEKQNQKRRMSQTEDFLKEFRPQFAEATKDINTASLEKKDSRRLKRIKEI